jgi:multidrug efflux system outer membrane protein
VTQVRQAVLPALLVLLSTALLNNACTLGPNYQRPAMAIPPQFRGATAPAQAPSLADQKWVELFNDPTLTQLVNAALERNFDVRIAAEHVLEARAQLGITRANQFPFIDGQVNLTTQGSSTLGSSTFLPPGTNLNVSYTTALATISWDADIWGRLRRLTESARAQYLASEEGRRAVIVSLVGDVMNNYFTLLEEDLELSIARQTVEIANNNLRLVGIRHDRGAASSLDVYQAQQLLYTATAQIAAVQREIGQTEDALSLLAGDAPHPIDRSAQLERMPLPPQIPAGLPSDLLTRRPDIRQAEDNLIAANAQIGAVRASYLPDISLTGFLGSQTRDLTELIANGAAREFSIAEGTIFPIFHAGQIRNAIRLTEAQQREALIAYRKSVYTALRDVSDALISHDDTLLERAEEEKLVNALDATVRVATMRYQGGLDSYLQVLDAQRNLFEGQLTLAQLRLGETLAVVQLYRALGGGWQ